MSWMRAARCSGVRLHRERGEVAGDELLWQWERSLTHRDLMPRAASIMLAFRSIPTTRPFAPRRWAARRATTPFRRRHRVRARPVGAPPRRRDDAPTAP